MKKLIVDVCTDFPDGMSPADVVRKCSTITMWRGALQFYQVGKLKLLMAGTTIDDLLAMYSLKITQDIGDYDTLANTLSNDGYEYPRVSSDRKYNGCYNNVYGKHRIPEADREKLVASRFSWGSGYNRESFRVDSSSCNVKDAVLWMKTLVAQYGEDEVLRVLPHTSMPLDVLDPEILVKYISGPTLTNIDAVLILTVLSPAYRPVRRTASDAMRMEFIKTCLRGIDNIVSVAKRFVKTFSVFDGSNGYLPFNLDIDCSKCTTPLCCARHSINMYKTDINNEHRLIDVVNDEKNMYSELKTISDYTVGNFMTACSKAWDISGTTVCDDELALLVKNTAIYMLRVAASDARYILPAYNATRINCVANTENRVDSYWRQTKTPFAPYLLFNDMHGDEAAAEIKVIQKVIDNSPFKTMPDFFDTLGKSDVYSSTVDGIQTYLGETYDIYNINYDYSNCELDYNYREVSVGKYMFAGKNSYTVKYNGKSKIVIYPDALTKEFKFGDGSEMPIQGLFGANIDKLLFNNGYITMYDYKMLPLSYINLVATAMIVFGYDKFKNMGSMELLNILSAIPSTLAKTGKTIPDNFLTKAVKYFEKNI